MKSSDRQVQTVEGEMRVSQLGCLASVLAVLAVASGCGRKTDNAGASPVQNSVGTPFELPISGFSGVIALNDDPIRAHAKTSYRLKFWDKSAGGSQNSPFHDPAVKGIPGAVCAPPFHHTCHSIYSFQL